MLEPMTYKQSASFVSVPTMLGAQIGQPGSLLNQLSTASGPSCPLPNCTKTMNIQRYLMPALPQVMTVSFTYEAMGAAAYDSNILSAVYARIETSFDVQGTYKGVAAPTAANLVGMLTCSQGQQGGPQYLGFFVDPATGQWGNFDHTSTEIVGTEWTAVTAYCTQQALQPACLFFKVTQICPPCDSAAPASAPPA